MQYRAGLLQLVARCRAATDEAMRELRAHWPRPTEGDSIRVGDAIPGDITGAIRRAASKLGDLDRWVKRLVGLSVEANRDSVDDRLVREIDRAIGVNVEGLLRANGPLLQSMQSATADNIALIKSIPENYFGRVTETITGGWVQGIRWESLVDQIARDGEITENRAALIARDQTAKMNSAFNQERQQQVGIERYEWSTSQDERVRPSHADMEGEICDWDDPPEVDGEKVHPGMACNCRCVALPVADMAELAFSEQQNEQEIAA